MMKKNGSRVLNNQKGFTLIEIISVLVILGILAVVAVPKYIDLQDAARDKAAQAAIAETQARLSMNYGKYLLVNGTPPADIADICNLADSGLPADCDGTVPDIGDFAVTLADTGAITVTAVDGKTVSVGGTWTLP